MSTTNTYAKIGSVLYVVWALLHLLAAKSVYVLGQGLEPSMVKGRIYQDAWNLLFFSIAAIGVAVALNWKNSASGYWINLGVVGVADVGFILFVVMPGYMPFWPGVVGPAVWLVALAFSTIGLFGGKRSS
jgi:hypothetical protein